MSFHKRFYSWDKIKYYTKNNEFSCFDIWVSKPNSHILGDNESNAFFKAYFSLNDDQREILFGCLKDESDNFSKNLIKYINVVMHKDNKYIHESSINSYNRLFIEKWGRDKSKKYKSIIQIK